MMDSSFGPKILQQLVADTRTESVRRTTADNVPILPVHVCECPSPVSGGRQYRRPDHGHFAPDRTGVSRKRMERRKSVHGDRRSNCSHIGYQCNYERCWY